MNSRDDLLKILDIARWAPSGDNTQPWRFAIDGDDHIVVHGFDTRDHVVYDFDGHPSQIAHGALLESIRIAATGLGFDATWSLRADCPDTAPIYDVRLVRRPHVTPDPLLPFIRDRVVQRRPMSFTPLTGEQKEALAAAAGPDYELRFLESFSDRLKVARLLWDNAYIRLTCPEAYAVHRSIIEWGARYSKDRLPERALGVDPLTGKLMKWVMQSWERVDFFNRYLFGTVAPRLQMDALPAVGCAAHVVIRALRQPVDVEGHVRAGIAMQRIWLTATAQGLYLQPELTPVIFRWYARAGKTISMLAGINSRLLSVARRFEKLIGAKETDPVVFFCRIGHSVKPDSRSTRMNVDELMHVRSSPN